MTPVIEEHPIIAALAPDPRRPSDVAKLSGLVGKADDPAQLRVYTDSTLRSFVDIPRANVRHSAPTATGETAIWFDSLTPLTMGVSESTTAQAMFLRGPIATSNLAALGTNVRMPFLTTVPCLITGAIIATIFISCKGCELNKSDYDCLTRDCRPTDHTLCAPCEKSYRGCPK